MSCTTILVGCKASNDGSTMIARTDDGHFDVKKLVVMEPKRQKKIYKSVISHVEIELPDKPLRYTACPSVDPKDGIWAATGINAANVGMTATETITSNPRVLAADPLVELKKAEKRGEKEIPGGIGEEDIVVLVLPYIRSAREGVLRLAELLEKYGTYESNGIAFNDEDEVWWLRPSAGITGWPGGCRTTCASSRPTSSAWTASTWRTPSERRRRTCARKTCASSSATITWT